MKFAITLALLAALCVDLGFGMYIEPKGASGARGIFYKKEVYVDDDNEPGLDRHDLKCIKSQGETAKLAASTVIEKLKAVPHLIKGLKHNVISAIKLGILAQVDGLSALKAAHKAKRLGHHKLAHKVRRAGHKAVRAGKALLHLIKVVLLRCMKNTAEILQHFYGVDVADLFSRARDPRLALRAAHLANKAAKEAHKSKHRANKAKHHAEAAAKVALEIADNETDKK